MEFLPKVLGKRKEPHPTTLVNTGKSPPARRCSDKNMHEKGDSEEPPGSHKSRLEIFLPPTLTYVIHPVVVVTLCERNEQ
jgi:hypothetical protein